MGEPHRLLLQHLFAETNQHRDPRSSIEHRRCRVELIGRRREGRWRPTTRTCALRGCASSVRQPSASSSEALGDSQVGNPAIAERCAARAVADDRRVLRPRHLDFV
jgi:hypothetical protein